MKRIFWFGAGMVAGVALSRKAGQAARQATPAGLASNLGDAVRELAGALGAFGADVRAGMSEREHELHDVVEHARRPVAGASGHAAGHRGDVAAHSARAGWQSSPAGQSGRRARRADG